ncbi:MAG: hypothetical protein WCK67_06900 [bacterium]
MKMISNNFVSFGATTNNKANNTNEVSNNLNYTLTGASIGGVVGDVYNRFRTISDNEAIVEFKKTLVDISKSSDEEFLNNMLEDGTIQKKFECVPAELREEAYKKASSITKNIMTKDPDAFIKTFIPKEEIQKLKEAIRYDLVKSSKYWGIGCAVGAGLTLIGINLLKPKVKETNK